MIGGRRGKNVLWPPLTQLRAASSAQRTHVVRSSKAAAPHTELFSCGRDERGCARKRFRGVQQGGDDACRPKLHPTTSLERPGLSACRSLSPLQALSLHALVSEASSPERFPTNFDQIEDGA